MIEMGWGRVEGASARGRVEGASARGGPAGRHVRGRGVGFSPPDVLICRRLGLIDRAASRTCERSEQGFLRRRRDFFNRKLQK